MQKKTEKNRNISDKIRKRFEKSGEVCYNIDMCPENTEK